MIKNEIALKYAKGLANYCEHFKECKDGCIFNYYDECVIAQDYEPASWNLKDVNYESNRDTDKT